MYLLYRYVGPFSLLLLRSLLAIYVAVPLAALAIARLVSLPAGVRTAILVLAISSDGETLYAGTQGEAVFRLSTLRQADFDRLGASFGR